MKLAPAPTRELQLLREARLRQFKRIWRAHRDLGYTDLIRNRDGRRRLIEQVSADLATALWPCDYAHPSPPMTGRGQPAPASMSGHPYDVVTDDEVRAYVDEDPFVREGLRRSTAAHLAFIERFKPKARRA